MRTVQPGFECCGDTRKNALAGRARRGTARTGLALSLAALAICEQGLNWGDSDWLFETVVTAASWMGPYYAARALNRRGLSAWRRPSCLATSPSRPSPWRPPRGGNDVRRAAAYLFGLAPFCATITDAIFGVNSFSSPGNAGAAFGSATGAFIIGCLFAGIARLFTRSHGKNWTVSFVVGVIRHAAWRPRSPMSAPSRDATRTGCREPRRLQRLPAHMIYRRQLTEMAQ